jgi:3-methyladenine DNA glycosylase/8-oxoguanine DNA glycosylase
MKKYFKYKKVTVEQIQQLINKEPFLGKFIDLKNPFTIRIMPDHFQCIVHTIISQQLHSAAVDSI